MHFQTIRPLGAFSLSSHTVTQLSLPDAPFSLEIVKTGGPMHLLSAETEIEQNRWEEAMRKAAVEKVEVSD